MSQQLSLAVMGLWVYGLLRQAKRTCAKADLLWFVGLELKEVGRFDCLNTMVFLRPYGRGPRMRRSIYVYIDMGGHLMVSWPG